MATYEHVRAYALIRSIERDARSMLRAIFSDDELSVAIDDQLLAALKRRAEDDDIDAAAASVYELIQYSDFGDLSKLIRKAFQGQRLPPHFKSFCESLEALQRVRKRLMHSRNMRTGDSALVSSHVKALLEVAGLHVPELREMSDQILRDPGYLLGIEFPDAAPRVWNNLPSSDTSDTGLIGRDDDLSHLSTLLRSDRPVVSLIGDGGVGKSALALEAVYELLDADDCPFEAVVWSSMKTQSFGPAGVRQIGTDINSAASLYFSLQETLGLAKASTIEEILEFLTSFRTLLVLDNLETINSAEIRELLRGVPNNSKILITSRVGVGEFEERYSVLPLSSTSAVHLLRLMANLLNAAELKEKPNSALASLAEALYFNPLAIRWFVGAVSNGSPTEIAIESRNDLLRYCFTNIFERLSAAALRLIKTFQLARRPLTYAEMSFFCPDVDVIPTLNELLQTSILRPGTSRSTTRPIYILGDFASDYLRSEYPPSSLEFHTFVALDATAHADDFLKNPSQLKKFKPTAIVIDDSDRDAAIAAIFLRQAMVQARQHQREEAFQAIERAKKCAPDMADVYKIAAWVATQFDEYFIADEYFQIARELGADLAHVHAVYSNFCINVLKSRFEEALKSAKRALDLERCSATLFYVARAAVACHDLTLALCTVDEILKDVSREAEFYHRSAYTLGVQSCKIALEDLTLRPQVEWISRGLAYAQASYTHGFTDQQLVSSAVKFIEEVAYHVLGNLTLEERNKTIGLLQQHAPLFEALCPIEFKQLQAWLEVSQDRVSEVDQIVKITEPKLGIVTRYIPVKQFGFIRDLQSSEILFFHRSAVSVPFDDLRIQGQEVCVYAFEPGRSGKCAIATDVRPGRAT